MAKAAALMRWIAAGRFLPLRLQNWLFSTGTRVVKVTGGLGLIGYALVFKANGEKLLSYKIYYKFDTLPIPFSVGVFMLTGAMMLLCAWPVLRRRIGQYRAQMLSGYLTIFGGFLWFLVSAAFISNAPPLNTGMVLTGILALMCLLAGHHLIVTAADNE